MPPARRSRCLGALAVAALESVAAQEPVRDLAVEADSVFFDAQEGRSVFKDLAVTDGTVTIRAAEGIVTENELDKGAWQFTGPVVITFETAMMSADSATFRFTAGRLTEGEVIGRPAEFETSATEGPKAFHGAAGRISYDRSRGALTAREGVSFVYDNTTVRNCDWTYSLIDGAFSAVSEENAKCVVSVAVSEQSR